MHNEQRGVLKEEMRKLDECDMEEFGRLESSAKTIAILGDRWWPQTAKQEGDRISTIAILGDRWWPQTAKQEGDRISKQFLCSTWKK